MKGLGQVSYEKLNKLLRRVKKYQKKKEKSRWTVRKKKHPSVFIFPYKLTSLTEIVRLQVNDAQ